MSATPLNVILDRLVETPLIYPVTYRNVRRAVLHRFPCLVWYRVQDSLVTVLAWTHGKVDPSKVHMRLRSRDSHRWSRLLAI